MSKKKTRQIKDVHVSIKSQRYDDFFPSNDSKKSTKLPLCKHTGLEYTSEGRGQLISLVCLESSTNFTTL